MVNNISDKAIIYDNVKLGKNVTIEPFAEIGKPIKIGKKFPPDLETIIGNGSYISSGTTIFAGVKTGKNFKTQEGARIEERCEFGDNIAIGFNTVVLGYCKFDSNIRIHALCLIPEYAKIENNVWVGPCVDFTNAPHPKCPKAKICEKDYSIILKEFCKIGGGVRTYPGVTIGAYSLIGAGALVTKSVPDKVVVAGHPAKIIKKIEDLTCWDAKKYGIDKPYK